MRFRAFLFSGWRKEYKIIYKKQIKNSILYLQFIDNEHIEK